ncbi:group IV decarboxylase [Cavenderia fasciculata]|uniref:Group IV decarboxylase n=1 Tax=Cavenderia fasciculata TaxID=261658 RepID=F4PMH1_CACFS|nr:group IV decarboxylase [Cavenderia fasciculata]EGG23618.1 group IV decarboxylase [Cavenderia fasciculata]|eukprot:XP_004361469.1 group IV decarboxylase [Cavenderia fasciculata]
MDTTYSESVDCKQWKKDAMNLAIKNNIFGDEPLIMVYNLDHFRALAKESNDRFNGIQTMAVKSNPVMSLLKEAIKSGLGAEVASFGELKIAELAGFTPDKIIYDSPIKTIQELEYAINLGVVINVDNFQEMDRVVEIVEKLDEKKKSTLVIGIRVNPQVQAGKYADLSTGVPTSKFGIGLDDSRERIISYYTQYNWMRGVHLHVGSQGFEMYQTSDAVVKVMSLVKEINGLTNNQITHVNVGGGLSVNFDTEQDKPTFTDYSTHLKERIPELFDGSFTLISEFGRSYWAKCGVVISQVEYAKKSGGRDIAVVHAGANLYIRTIYQHPLWKLRVTVFDSTGVYQDGKDGASVMDLAGPCCFAADLLVKERLLPTINKGDYVMVHDSGAYFYSSYSHYNLRLAPPIFAVESVDGKTYDSIKQIKKGETIEQKIAFFS